MPYGQHKGEWSLWIWCWDSSLNYKGHLLQSPAAAYYTRFITSSLAAAVCKQSTTAADDTAQHQTNLLLVLFD
jgi:hypothetical protein